MPRWQFSLALARNEIEGTTVNGPTPSEAPRALLAGLSQRLLGARLPEAVGDDLLAALQAAGAQDEDLSELADGRAIGVAGLSVALTD